MGRLGLVPESFLPHPPTPSLAASGPQSRSKRFVLQVHDGVRGGGPFCDKAGDDGICSQAGGAADWRSARVTHVIVVRQAGGVANGPPNRSALLEPAVAAHDSARSARCVPLAWADWPTAMPPQRPLVWRVCELQATTNIITGSRCRRCSPVASKSI